MELLTVFIASVTGFVAGVVALLAYIIQRMMSNDDWDDSNMTNALRLLSHVTLHPHDFGKMSYVEEYDYKKIAEYMPGVAARIEDRRPFWYVSKDEFSGVVKTRP